MTADGFEPYVPRAARTIAAPNLENEAMDRAIDDADRDDVAETERTGTLPKASIAQPVTIIACDPRRCRAQLRDLAIHLAGEACARAMRIAIARNPLFVARFVDDAMRAEGRSVEAKVRLHPADARTCAGAIVSDIIADPALERGEVRIDSPHGTLGATIAERASKLVRAAADA